MIVDLDGDFTCEILGINSFGRYHYKANGQLFGPPDVYEQPYSVAVGDVTGDGVLGTAIPGFSTHQNPQPKHVLHAAFSSKGQPGHAKKPLASIGVMPMLDAKSRVAAHVQEAAVPELWYRSSFVRGSVSQPRM